MKKLLTTIALVFGLNANAQNITTVANINMPGFIASDTQGYIYISSFINSRIYSLNPMGGTSSIAGNGTLGYSGEGSAATAAELQNPTGIAVDVAGNVYIADNGNSRIRKVQANTGIITTIAGTGTQGYGGDGAAATSAELNAPEGIAVDLQGNIYIADEDNNRIRKIMANTGIITTIAGNGTAGYNGDGGAATVAELYAPTGIALDAVGNVYIADNGNSRIRKVTANTGIITTIAGNGTQGYGGDGGTATAAKLSNPMGVVLDASGNIYIADYANYRVRKIDASTGVITTIAGNGTGGYSGDGGAATAAELHYPAGLAFDASYNLYIGDYGNNVIRKVYNNPINVTASSYNACQGSNSSFTLTASNASTYTWSTNAGSAQTTSVVVTPSVTSTYTVQTSSSIVTQTVVTITIFPLVNVIVNSFTICAGQQTATLTASGSASIYNWNTGETTASINPEPTATTVYTVTGTSANNCKNVATSTVTVNTLPTVTVNPASYTVCPYAPVTFTASGANTYTWSNGTTATGASINVSPAYNSSYQVKGTDANGCNSTSYAYGVVHVYSTNYGITFSAAQQLYTTPPFVVQFSNTTPNPTSYTFTWLFGDGQSQQTNNASVFHQYNYNGNYDVTLIAVDNSTGCADTLFKGGYIYCTGGTTDIEQTRVNSNQINIYPNPNNGTFIIETNSSEKQSLQIFDVNGKLILSQSINDKANIDASSLNEGIYNVSIQSNTGVINRRIVITK